MNAHDILVRPLVTEKSVRQRDDLNQVAFAVPLDANKIQVRSAVEQVFGVKVLKVRTVRIKGKAKGWGLRARRKPDWKKAVVDLAPGDTIDVFGGV